MTVDIIVPVYQPNWECLDKVISAALDQEIPTSVGLVLDGPDKQVEQRLTEMTQAEPRVRYLVTEGFGTGDISRLEILDTPTSDFLIFLDDDVVATPTLAKQHADALESTPGIVLGQLETVIPPTSDPLRPGALLYDQWYQHNRESWLADPNTVAWSFWGGNFSGRRETMQRIRSFVTREQVNYSLDSFYGLIANELGIPVTYRDDIVARHFVEKPIDQVPGVGYAYGSAAAVMARGINNLLPKKAADYRGPALKVQSFPGAKMLTRLYGKRPITTRNMLIRAAARNNERGNDDKAVRYLSAAHVLELTRGYREHDVPNAISRDISQLLSAARAAAQD